MTQTTLIDKLLIGVVCASATVAILATVALAVQARIIHQPRVFLGGQEVFVEIADNSTLRGRGLSFRGGLGVDEGMLFVFPEPQKYGFWMKDMRFPIDIIWFDSERRIIEVWENADPASYPKIYTPHSPAQFVLEVPAGFFLKYQLETGNILEILR